MKKKYFFIICILFKSIISISQVSSYVFQQSNGTYTAITGGSLLGTATNDEQFFTDSTNLAGNSSVTTGVGFPIGFNFIFNGSTFDRLGIHTNGWISLGQSALSPAVNMGNTSTSNILEPISSPNTMSPAQLRNRIAGIGGDLQGQAGASLRVQTIGTAPYRILVVQWANYRRFNTNGDVLNFQIQLHETYNKVSIVYGTNSYTASTSNAYQVGIGGQSNSDFNNRGTAPTNGNWNESFQGSGNTTACFVNMGAVMPVTGLTYNWGAATPCSGAPVAGAVSPIALDLCTGASIGTLKVNGFSEFTTGLTYQWEQSNNNFATTPVNAVGGSGANSTSYTPPAFSGTNIYYRLKITCVNSGQTAYSAIIPITIKNAPTNQATNLNNSPGFNNTTLSWTNGNGARRMVVFSKSPIVPPINTTANALTANSVYAGSGQQIVYDGTGTSVVVTGLSLSSVYYVGVFEYNTCPNGSQFDYYYTTTVGTNTKIFGTIPQNDFCFGPTALIPSGSFNAGAILGTLYNATSTSGDPVPNYPSCQPLAMNDVWYTVVVPQSGRLKIETQVNSSDAITDTVLGVFSGADCFGLTQIACDDDSGATGPNDLMAVTTVSGRTPGETLFIGVWNKNSTPSLTNRLFKIAAHDAILSTESFDDSAFEYYPNPVADVLNLSYDKMIDNVVFYNLLGQEVVNVPVKAMQTKIDVSSIMKGTYMVRIIAGETSKVIKIVK